MNRKRATKALKATDLTVGRPEIGQPKLGRTHNLVAVGIPGKKKRKRSKKLREMVIECLEELRRQGHDLDKLRTSEIERLLVGVWRYKEELPNRRTVNRCLGRGKD
jgi:hypothetical protein